MLNDDFKEMLSELSAAGVEYLLIGAYAMATYGLPRATGDIDIWVRRSPENAERIWRALARFGAPMDAFDRKDFSREGTVIQIGVAPCRIDLLTSIDGVGFEEAWENRAQCDLDGLSVSVISRQDLIRNKQAVGRPQDRADVSALEGQDDESSSAS
ncbi:MAG: nucleotidyltransferase [Planctomycetota bacterium]